MFELGACDVCALRRYHLVACRVTKIDFSVKNLRTLTCALLSLINNNKRKCEELKQHNQIQGERAAAKRQPGRVDKAGTRASSASSIAIMQSKAWSSA